MAKQTAEVRIDELVLPPAQRSNSEHPAETIVRLCSQVERAQRSLRKLSKAVKRFESGDCYWECRMEHARARQAEHDLEWELRRVRESFAPAFETSKRLAAEYEAQRQTEGRDVLRKGKAEEKASLAELWRRVVDAYEAEAERDGGA